MPYIDKQSRNRYDDLIDDLIQRLGETQKIHTTAVFNGHLNYILTRVVLGAWIAAAKNDDFKIGYADIADMKSCLNEAADEISRRLLADYENKAAQRNGDVKEYQDINKLLKL